MEFFHGPKYFFRRLKRFVFNSQNIFGIFIKNIYSSAMNLQLVLFITVIITMFLAVFAIYYFWRLRFVTKRSHFECDYRRDLNSGWVSGCASYGLRYLHWYRFVAFTPRPQRSWSRRNMEIGKNIEHRHVDGVEMVVLPITVGDDHFFIYLSEADYHGLVSWIEACPTL